MKPTSSYQSRIINAILCTAAAGCRGQSHPAPHPQVEGTWPPDGRAWRGRGPWGTRLLALFLVVAAPALAQVQWFYETNNGAITIAAYNGSSAAVAVPDTIDGLPVTSIAELAFEGCQFLVRVTIGSNVTSIGGQAFAFDQSLSGVYFQGNAPSPSTDLSVFSYDNNPTVYYLAGTTGWGSTFDGVPAVACNPQIPFVCTTNSGALTLTAYIGPGGLVTVPATINGLPVTAMGAYAFYSCSNLASVTIPDGVTNIGGEAFALCTSLTNVTIPDSVDSIGVDAFGRCTSLGSITIPNSVTSIGADAFYGCSSLTNVTLGNGVASIGDTAFSSCTSLKTITFPGSVTNLGTLAFDSCTGLKAVYFQGNTPSGGFQAFDNGTVYYLPGTTGWGSGFGGTSTAPWALPYPLILTQSNGSNLGVQSNGFGFVISWATNLSVAVEAATSLTAPVWTPVAVSPLVGGWAWFSDPQWTNYPTRFYRVRAP